MTDYSELVERMRAYPANRLCIQVADALEAQARDIAVLGRRISECDDARDWLIERNRTLDARIAELERENRRVKNIIYAYEAARAALKGERG